MYRNLQKQIICLNYGVGIIWIGMNKECLLVLSSLPFSTEDKHLEEIKS